MQSCFPNCSRSSESSITFDHNFQHLQQLRSKLTAFFRSQRLLTITNLQCLQQLWSWPMAFFFFFFFFFFYHRGPTPPPPPPTRKILRLETKCELLRSNMTNLKMPLSKIKGKLQAVVSVCTWQKKRPKCQRKRKSKLQVIVKQVWTFCYSHSSTGVQSHQSCQFFYHNCKWCYQDMRIMSPDSIWKHLLTHTNIHVHYNKNRDTGTPRDRDRHTNTAFFWTFRPDCSFIRGSSYETAADDGETFIIKKKLL